MTFSVQSVLIPRKHYTKLQALNWIRKNEYKVKHYGKPVDITKNYYRFRQMAPSRFNKKSFRTIKKKDNIRLIMGKLISP